MPLIYRVNLNGSNAIRYFPVPLTEFYLHQAHKNAHVSRTEHNPIEALAHRVSAILFASMALEAFANELSEDVIPREQTKEFNSLKGAYRKKKGEPEICAKLRILFAVQHHHVLDPLMEGRMRRLVSLRNNLVHYKLSESSGKHFLPPTQDTRMEGGRCVANFTSEPERIEPPFIEGADNASAVEGFNTALLIINQWSALSGEPSYVPDLAEIV